MAPTPAPCALSRWSSEASRTPSFKAMERWENEAIRSSFHPDQWNPNWWVMKSQHDVCFKANVSTLCPQTACRIMSAHQVTRPTSEERPEDSPWMKLLQYGDFCSAPTIAACCSCVSEQWTFFFSSRPSHPIFSWQPETRPHLLSCGLTLAESNAPFCRTRC